MENLTFDTFEQLLYPVYAFFVLLYNFTLYIIDRSIDLVAN